MGSTSEPICQALNLSDSKPCTESATVWDGLFCRFHGKQCHGLYAGYKKRNAQLDGLADQAPPHLKSTDTPLANELFETVRDETTLNDIHSHLFKEYVLLGKVIDARKLHHKHFYPLKLDYGHQAYLDTLSSRKHIVLRALERVVKRTAEVLYAKEKWYQWVGDVQHEEEQNREKEAKKVKLEAAMFKRHWKKMQTRLRAQREKEDRQRQEAFLENAYQQRLKGDAELESDEDAEEWDPIEDVLDDERGRYIDLIKHFLWMEVLNNDDERPSASEDLTVATQSLTVADNAPAKKTKKKSKAKGAKAETSVSKPKSSDGSAPKRLGNGVDGQSQMLAMMKRGEPAKSREIAEPDKSNIETEEEMRKRLKEGVEKNYDDVRGPILVGSLEMPHGTFEKTPPLEDDEIDTLMQDVKEIKLLLFCRLLLSHATLLPAAVKATSVDEFLNDAEIPEADLRDLCLRVEQPSLQDIRDACADLIREHGPEPGEIEESEFEDLSFEDIILQDIRYGHLQGSLWFYDNMLAQRARQTGEPVLGLKDYLMSTLKKPERVKVEICGKSIWNYSSESSMSREGWLQFSVLAKGCDLRNAVELCRNWDEFSELNFLVSWQYFPASHWVAWGTDRFTKQLHEMGFYPFFMDLSADSMSHHHQAGGSRSHQRKQHDFIEARNIMAGQMKRDDSVTRRFIQYLTIRTGELLVAVRDGRTGKIVTAPTDKEEFWTLRSKKGLGRATRNEWTVELEVGPEYFAWAEEFRNWDLGFDDYYEVWIWHFAPGQQGTVLYNVVTDQLRKAWRISRPSDVYRQREPLFRSLTRNPETKRVRLVKDGETVETLWDEVNRPDNMFLLTDGPGRNFKSIRHDEVPDNLPARLFYNEADAAEDTVLFPDELTSPNRDVRFKALSTPITRLEVGGGTKSKFMARMFMEKSQSLHQKHQNHPLPGDTYIDSDGEEWSLHSGDSVYELETDDEDILPDADLDDEAENEANDIIKHWRLPRLWANQTAKINQTDIDAKQKRMLSNVGLLERFSGKIQKAPTLREFAQMLKETPSLMLMEKDRGDALLETFHAGDLEPGAPEKYEETCAIVSGILNQTDLKSNSLAWLWFSVGILDWLNVRADYDDYTDVATAPWPHPFIIQDILKAWAYMSIFFPDLEQCQPANEFFRSEEGKKYQESALHDPAKRAATLPDIRTKTSFRYRPRHFWKEWFEICDKDWDKTRWYAEAYPMEMRIAMRPILAKLYMAGILSPCPRENHPIVVPGLATAMTESHRPDKKDLFIDYSDRCNASNWPKTFPGLVHPHEFPLFLPLAQKFAAAHPDARFAVLRLWSAPHFYPAMLGDHNKMHSSFLDCHARSWMWNFIPKDMPNSEWSMYNNLKLRLGLMADRFGDDRVVHRSDVVLVMGTDQADLLRYATAVTFVVQTKPWFREFDLWKSFVNVDLGFLEGLDGYWLD